MKRVLLDANVMIGVMFKGDERHREAVAAAWLAGKISNLLLSPATFIILNYYIQKDFKRTKNKTLKDTRLRNLFRFKYTAIDDAVIRQAERSSFHDKEDALQYYSALHAGAGAIITFDVHDFYPYASELKIYAPIEFVQSFIV